MKNKLLFTFVFITILHSINVSSQNSRKEYGITAGVLDKGVGANFLYKSYSSNEGKYFKLDLLVTVGNQTITSENIIVPHKGVFLNAGYYFSTFDINRGAFVLSTGLGVSLGYQQINNGKKELSNGGLITSKDTIVYGGYLGFDLSIFLSDSWSIHLNGTQYIYANSNLGSGYPYVGGGLVYTLF